MGEHKGTENLIPLNKRSKEVQREIQEKGRKANKKKAEERKTIKACLKLMIDEGAPEKIRRAFDRNGYDVTTHREAITAAILMGAMKGEPKMVDKALELLGEDYRMNARLDELQIQKDRLEMEKARAEVEKKAKEAYIEALKSQQEAEMEDDGFMDALKGTAKDDWTDEDNTESTISL